MDRDSRKSDLPWSSRWRELWARAGPPLKVGILCGLLGAVLAAVGLVRGASEPFSWRGLAMAILLAGGSWGLVSWALTMAIMEVGQDREPTGEE